MRRTLTLATLAGVALLGGCRGVLGIEDPVVSADAATADAEAVDAVGLDAAPTGASLVFLGQVGSGADAAPYTFADVPLGAPAADRRLIIVAHGRSAASAFGPATVRVSTVGPAAAGAVATRLVAANETVLGGTISMHILAVPTGTSASIELAFQGPCSGDCRAGIGVWAAYGLTSSTPVAVDMIDDGMTSGQLMLDGVAGGVVVAGVTIGNPTLPVSSTWLGVTEAYDSTVDGSLMTGAAGLVSATDILTFSNTATDTSTAHRLVGATFR